ncbi:peptidyl-prolyl cis-trans isomerase [Kamptonema cortianum]|nr:peptidyl-prolyl cis-trans isomerase [Geitlerinema splendidum]MDK3158332.1 peptidyl-prolyl cis-trans isomerase [Kamptonema cortianum]
MRTVLLSLGILLAISSHAQTNPSKTLVVVNGAPITGANYMKRMEVLPGVGKLVGGRFVEATPGFLTLQTLINEMLMLQLAREKGVEPTAAQVDAELKRRLDANPEAMKVFELVGFTVEDFKYDIKVQMAEFNLTTMGINIADQQIEQFYRQQISEYTVPKRYKLRIVAVTSEAARTAVDQALAGGANFADVATQHSVDVRTKGNGGLMGDVPEDALNPETKSLVAAMKEGQTTPWAGGGDGTFVKIFLEKILPSQVLPLDASLKEEIRRRMMVDRGRVRNNIAKMMQEMREKAKIEYQGTPFDKQLKEVFEGGQ